MKRILGIVSTYGLLDIPQQIKNTFSSWKSQIGNYSLDVLISDNRSGPVFRQKVTQICKDYGFSFIWTDDELTLPVTRNLAMQVFAKGKGYDYVIHSCEDVVFSTPNDIQLMVNDFSDNIGCIVTRADHKFVPDHLEQSLFKRHGTSLRKKIKSSPSPYILGLYEMVCTNNFMISDYVYEKYGYRMVDKIFHDNFEPHLWYMAAAVGKRTGICNTTCVLHTRLDKSALRMKISGRRAGYNHLRPLCDVVELCKRGREIGYGFYRKTRVDGQKRRVSDESYLANEEMYENGVHKKQELLYQFLKDNFFLSDRILNYDKIQYESIIN